MPRTKTHLLTDDIWKSLTPAAKRSRKPSFVAVAYFGRGAAKLLPLRASSRLVVDASENAVKSGQTHPSDLKLLQKRGVIIYSLPNLHAKMYVCDGVALVGSANVSNHSARTLIESMLRTTDPNVVRSARSFIGSLCLNELSPGGLDRLQRMYRPPRLPTRVSERNKIARSSRADLPRLFLAQLDRGDPPEESAATEERGLKIAQLRRKRRRSYVLDSFNWSGKTSPFRKGDKIVQVVKEDDGHRLVDAPADVVHTQKWQRNGKHITFVYLELPKVRRVRLEKLARRLGYGAKKKLLRRGLVHNHQFAGTLLGAWRPKN